MLVVGLAALCLWIPFLPGFGGPWWSYLMTVEPIQVTVILVALPPKLVRNVCPRVRHHLYPPEILGQVTPVAERRGAGLAPLWQSHPGPGAA